jgi:hypothetical protein
MMLLLSKTVIWRSEEFPFTLQPRQVTRLTSFIAEARYYARRGGVEFAGASVRTYSDGAIRVHAIGMRPLTINDNETRTVHECAA